MQLERNWARLALLVLLAIAAHAQADAQPRLWARDDYPIPPESATRLFFIQRSVNPNTVVYEARLRADGTLDPEQPIEITGWEFRSPLHLHVQWS